MKIFNLSILFFEGAAVGGGEAIIGAEDEREVENRFIDAVYKRSGMINSRREINHGALGEDMVLIADDHLDFRIQLEAVIGVGAIEANDFVHIMNMGLPLGKSSGAQLIFAVFGEIPTGVYLYASRHIVVVHPMNGLLTSGLGISSGLGSCVKRGQLEFLHYVLAVLAFAVVDYFHNLLLSLFLLCE